MKVTWIKSILVLLVVFLVSASAFGRNDINADPSKGQVPSQSAASPAQVIVGHRIGQIELGVNNNGTFGTGFRGGPASDYFTGEQVPSCDYPKGSNIQYLFAGAFWIGAVVGRDTLVSVGADGWSFVRELAPDAAPFGLPKKRSIRDPNSPLYQDAISEEDYIMVYMDTLTEGVGTDYFGRPHRPLNIEVTQSSYAWSYSYAEDFVLFDYQIKNIGTQLLQEVYMGVYVDADVCFDCDNTAGYADDLCGFLYTNPSNYGGREFLDTTFIAWIADDDGNFREQTQATGVTATRIVRTPSDSLAVSFNWWISNGNASLDFGPRHRSPDLRDLRTGGMGTPEGDVNKYDFMRNGEFDYDQAFTATIQPSDSLWLYPNQEQAGTFADGFDTRYLLSFGPFEVRPGQTLPISLAYVAGADWHQVPGNEANLPNDPEAYYANINFNDLATNATWASWIYDNPGVDTDGDGYFGKYHVVYRDSAPIFIDTVIDGQDTTIPGWDYLVPDTFYYEGDGVPDFVGASPPPAPDFWLEPTEDAIRVRFNGLRSETTKDVFSKLRDFEGYRVYMGRDDRSASFALVASYDIEDYNKFVYNPNRLGGAGYELQDVPFTLEELICIYGDSCNDPYFSPLDYSSPQRPFAHPDFPDDSLFYFAPQDYNVSNLGVNTPIKKIYPDATWPSTLDPDSAEAGELTEDGYFKYFEYEVTIDGLLATVPFYVNVTAFDFGSPESGLASLETSVTAGTQVAYPQPSWQEARDRNLKVIVYPNPYLGSGDYRETGFEGRLDADRPPDRTRELHFANLPPKATIRIYTLDGDLVREIKHNKPVDDPTASHETWNLITRNTQAVVSGLYYWTVEDESGNTQLGKFAIIM